MQDPKRFFENQNMKKISLILISYLFFGCEPTPISEGTGVEEGLLETPQASGDCEIAAITKTSEHLSYSPDGSQYFISKQDAVDGVFQIYIGETGETALTCISNYDAQGNSGGLLRSWEKRNKVMVQWHPSGDFIICGVEKEFYPELIAPYDLRLGWIQSGLWLDIWAVKPDGSIWYNLAQLEKGMTGPAFTPDGTKAVYADAQSDSDLSVDVFGKWKLQLVDFRIDSSEPSFSNSRDISPAGARWLEPGNFAPDGVSLLFNSDIGMDNAEGQDQYILDIESGEVTNLTNSPKIWDEHGVFSPSGNKILFMSSYPYRHDSTTYRTLSIKTEFMIMDRDGSNLEQLTHFRTEGYPEYHEGIASTGYWNEDGTIIYAHSLEFPNYHNWVIEHQGACGE